MNLEDIELRLLLGMPIEIDGLGSVISPKIKEVAKIGENTYSEYLGTLLFSKENIDKEVSEGLTEFQLFCVLYSQIESFREKVNKSIEFFMNSEAHLNIENAFFYLVNGESVYTLNEENFHVMQEHLRLANFIKSSSENEEQYNPANEEAAKMIREMLERRRKKKPKPTVDLRSIISGMSWKCPSVDISEKTIFQLYDGFKRLQNLDSLHYTMFGIYTGNVDAQKINMKDLNFALILKD